MGKGMTVKYLFDTNILIYYLNNEIPENNIKKRKKILDSSFIISAITKLELLGWNKLTKEGITIVRNFLKSSQIESISNEIIDISIKIKQNSKIKAPDAIIAATALNNGLTIVTRNNKDFCKVDDLLIYNPFNI